MRTAKWRHSPVGTLLLGAAAFTLLMMACGGGGGGSTTPPVPATHTVAYDGNGNTGGSVPVDANTYLQGATVTVLGNTGSLVKTGDSFSGWNTVAGGSGTACTAGQTFTMGSANVTLYAQWSVTTNLGFAYVANHNGGSEGAISQFAIGPNGALSPLSPPTVDAGGNDTWWVATDPLGKYLYATNPAANNQQGTLTQFTINHTNGSLSPMAPLSVPFLAGWNSAPGKGVAHPTNPWFYLINTQPGSGAAVAQFTGGATGGLTSPSLLMVGQNPQQVIPYGIAVDPAGKYAYVSARTGAGPGGVFQFTINQSTGALQPDPSSTNNLVPTVPLGSLAWADPWDIKVLQMSSGSEYAYVTNYDDGTVWEFSVNADGTLTTSGSLQVAPSSVCPCQTGGNNLAAMDIAFHPSGKYAYITFSCCSSLQSVAQFTVNQSNGTLSPMTPPTVLSSGSAASIMVDSSGKYAYVTSGATSFASSSIAQYTIDQVTGALTLMATPTVQTGGVGPSGIVTVAK